MNTTKRILKPITILLSVMRKHVYALRDTGKIINTATSPLSVLWVRSKTHQIYEMKMTLRKAIGKGGVGLGSKEHEKNGTRSGERSARGKQPRLRVRVRLAGEKQSRYENLVRGTTMTACVEVRPQ